MTKRLIVILVIVLAVGALSSAAANLNDGDRLLVWTAPAEAPQQQFADLVGDLAYIESDGAVNTIAPVLLQSSLVELCTMNALSPDGRHLAVYQGTEGGIVASLFMMTDGSTPMLVDDSFNLLACRGGSGTLTYSEDSSRIAYIDYERTNQVDFADGYLRVVNTAELTEEFSDREVTSFALAGDVLTYARFFTDTFNEADELAIIQYDLASGSEREIATYFVQDDEICRFLNAKLAENNGDVYLSLVERCDNQQANQMTVYRIPADGSEPAALFSEESRAQFAPFSETNNMIFANDGVTMLYTLPDGITNNTVALYGYNLDSGEKTTIIENNIVVPTFSGTGNNATWQISRDGRWLAAVLNAPNFDARVSLRIVSLDDPSAPLVGFDNRSQEDQLPVFTFNANNDAVIFVGGGVNGDDNSLFLLPIQEGAEAQRILRGNFARWAAASPVQTELAIMEYNILEDGIRGQDWLDTVIIDLETAEKTTVFVGGEIIDDEATNYRFAQPLLWVRGQ